MVLSFHFSESKHKLRSTFWTAGDLYVSKTSDPVLAGSVLGAVFLGHKVPP